MDVSRCDASALYVAASGRGAPGGGIALVRSLRMTFSHVSAFAEGCSTSSPASVRPAVFRRSLWQVTQYLVTVAEGVAGCVFVVSGFNRTDCASAAVGRRTPAKISEAAVRHCAGIRRYLTRASCVGVRLRPTPPLGAS